MGATDDGWSACEHLGANGGSIQFFSSKMQTIKLDKTASPLHVDESASYLGFNKTYALGSHADLLGNTLLKRAAQGQRDLTLAEITSLVPPLVPGLIVIITGPSTVGTRTLPPFTASSSVIGRSNRTSSPSRR